MLADEKKQQVRRTSALFCWVMTLTLVSLTIGCQSRVVEKPVDSSLAGSESSGFGRILHSKSQFDEVISRSLLYSRKFKKMLDLMASAQNQSPSVTAFSAIDLLIEAQKALLDASPDSTKSVHRVAMLQLTTSRVEEKCRQSQVELRAGLPAEDAFTVIEKSEMSEAEKAQMRVLISLKSCRHPEEFRPIIAIDISKSESTFNFHAENVTELFSQQTLIGAGPLSQCRLNLGPGLALDTVICHNIEVPLSENEDAVIDSISWHSKKDSRLEFSLSIYVDRKYRQSVARVIYKDRDKLIVEALKDASGPGNVR